MTCLSLRLRVYHVLTNLTYDCPCREEFGIGLHLQRLNLQMRWCNPNFRMGLHAKIIVLEGDVYDDKYDLGALVKITLRISYQTSKIRRL